VQASVYVATKLQMLPKKLTLLQETNRQSYVYRVTTGSAAWFGPQRPSRPRPLIPVLPIGFLQQTLIITRNTFCGTWYLPHSHVHNERTVLL